MSAEPYTCTAGIIHIRLPQILNLNVVLYIPGRSFFKDLVKLISESINHNLDQIIKSGKYRLYS